MHRATWQGNGNIGRHDPAPRRCGCRADVRAPELHRRPRIRLVEVPTLARLDVQRNEKNQTKCIGPQISQSVGPDTLPRIHFSLAMA